VPWAAPDGNLRYYDLRQHPELLLYVTEAIRYPELGEFLASVNSSRSPWQTAKCDVWFTSELSPEEEFYGTAGKFGGYLDLFFASWEYRGSFAEHEFAAQQLTQLLHRAPELPSSLELIIRRAYFDGDPSREVHDGFCFTAYIFGYGDELHESRNRWAVAMKLVQNALLQVGAKRSEG
jgi:hypothetical protein